MTVTTGGSGQPFRWEAAPEPFLSHLPYVALPRGLSDHARMSSLDTDAASPSSRQRQRQIDWEAEMQPLLWPASRSADYLPRTTPDVVPEAYDMPDIAASRAAGADDEPPAQRPRTERPATRHGRPRAPPPARTAELPGVSTLLSAPPAATLAAAADAGDPARLPEPEMPSSSSLVASPVADGGRGPPPEAAAAAAAPPPPDTALRVLDWLSVDRSALERGRSAVRSSALQALTARQGRDALDARSTAAATDGTGVDAPDEAPRPSPAPAAPSDATPGVPRAPAALQLAPSAAAVQAVPWPFVGDEAPSATFRLEAPLFSPAQLPADGRAGAAGAWTPPRISPLTTAPRADPAAASGDASPPLPDLVTWTSPRRLTFTEFHDRRAEYLEAVTGEAEAALRQTRARLRGVEVGVDADLSADGYDGLLALVTRALRAASRPSGGGERPPPERPRPGRQAGAPQPSLDRALAADAAAPAWSTLSLRDLRALAPPRGGDAGVPAPSDDLWYRHHVGAGAADAALREDWLRQLTQLAAWRASGGNGYAAPPNPAAPPRAPSQNVTRVDAPVRRGAAAPEPSSRGAPRRARAQRDAASETRWIDWQPIGSTAVADGARAAPEWSQLASTLATRIEDLQRSPPRRSADAQRPPLPPRCPPPPPPPKTSRQLRAAPPAVPPVFHPLTAFAPPQIAAALQAVLRSAPTRATPPFADSSADAAAAANRLRRQDPGAADAEMLVCSEACDPRLEAECAHSPRNSSASAASGVWRSDAWREVPTRPGADGERLAAPARVLLPPPPSVRTETLPDLTPAPSDSLAAPPIPLTRWMDIYRQPAGELAGPPPTAHLRPQNAPQAPPPWPPSSTRGWGNVPPHPVRIDPPSKAHLNEWIEDGWYYHVQEASEYGDVITA